MTGLEELGWYAFVVFAQLIGPLVWFLLARDGYESLSPAPRPFLPDDSRIR
ncbi:MAG: hypothetical protein Q7T15_04085 [Microcella sp.]|uniref:hypothetical protein n=1 Tax=Microcella sp. TaxID=1913979 RepID=UPI00272340A8|nr:hypothetical protein [Microcella sp.]MDO8337415.1 hypothetical protein [Microcella sp.]